MDPLALALRWDRLRLASLRRAYELNAGDFVEVVVPHLNRGVSLDAMPLDLPPSDGLEFEDLAGLLSSSRSNSGIASMTFRELAYVFGLARRMRARTAIEIGRFRGGTTIALAAGMRDGELWSIDNGEREQRFAEGGRSYDEQTADFLQRHGLAAHLLVGNSRTITVDTGEVDLVFIDGDHSYEGARSDFDRFGRRVRRGGAVLMDDAMEGHDDSVGAVVGEAVDSAEFRLVRAVDRLAHLERV